MSERHPIDLPDDFESDDYQDEEGAIKWVLLSAAIVVVLFVCAVFLWGYQA